MDAFTSYVLVDRAGLGGFEFLHDGKPIVFKKDQTERTVRGDVLPYIFTRDHLKVFTTDGEYVWRVAVRAAPGEDAGLEQVATEFGIEALDDSRIVIDRTRREGWDTRDLDMQKRMYVDINVPASELRERLGSRGLNYQER